MNNLIAEVSDFGILYELNIFEHFSAPKKPTVSPLNRSFDLAAFSTANTRLLQTSKSQLQKHSETAELRHWKLVRDAQAQGDRATLTRVCSKRATTHRNYCNEKSNKTHVPKAIIVTMEH